MVDRYDLNHAYLNGDELIRAEMYICGRGDFVYFSDYEDLHDKYIDMKVQFESLKDAIANLYRDY